MMKVERNRTRKTAQWIRFFISLVLLFNILVVADAQSVEWKSIIFGQSTGSGKNSITVNEAEKSVTLTAGTSDGKGIGGKVASGHDGIAYYYVELDTTKNFVLTGKIQVNFFAKDKPDNQESFGIMARDVIGKPLDETVMPSNMVLVGGYRGEIQSMYRDSVQDTSGAGAKRLGINLFAARPTNDGNSEYTVTMKKTNTGYHVKVNNSPEMIYYRPKLCEVLNPSKVYVGFFAARVASITVTDIEFSASDVATDPPGKPEPKEVFLPKDSVTSPPVSTSPDYELGVFTNSAGKFWFTINKMADSGVIAQPGVFRKKVTLQKDTNIIDIDFIATQAPDVKAMSRHIVVYRTYGPENGTLYVAPMGKDSGTGTKEDPLDIYSAFNFLKPGQTAVLTEGTYDLYRPVLVPRGSGGTAEKPKTVKGEGTVVLDFKNIATGVAIWSDYWKLFGFGITKSRDCGLRIFGNNNVVENVTTFANQNTGLQVSGISTEKRDMWPVNNLILNCVSYDNRDPSENNADGFAAKLTCGEGNVFRGCIAHHNCDDGWDLYSKLETGPIGVVVIENCIAYGNGSMSDGTKTKGDGNGFKLGGEGIAVMHVLRNSISFNNNSVGITNNSDPAVVVENTTSFNNGKGNYDFGIYSKSKPQFTVSNNLSFHTGEGKDDKSIDPVKSPVNFFYTDKVCANSEGKRKTAKDFESLEVGSFKRQEDGSFEPVTFLTLKKNKENIGAFIGDYTKITNPAAKK